MLTFDPNTSNDRNRYGVTRTRTGRADVRDDGFQEANVVRSGVRGVGKCPATFLVKPRQKQALEVQYYLNIQSSP